MYFYAPKYTISLSASIHGEDVHLNTFVNEHLKKLALNGMIESVMNENGYSTSLQLEVTGLEDEDLESKLCVLNRGKHLLVDAMKKKFPGIEIPTKWDLGLFCKGCIPETWTSDERSALDLRLQKGRIPFIPFIEVACETTMNNSGETTDNAEQSFPAHSTKLVFFLKEHKQYVFVTSCLVNEGQYFVDAYISKPKDSTEDLCKTIEEVYAVLSKNEVDAKFIQLIKKRLDEQNLKFDRMLSTLISRTVNMDDVGLV